MNSKEARIKLFLAEGIVSLPRYDAPSPHALWNELKSTQTPMLMFDFDTALITHTNLATEYMLEMSASELIQQTGRMLTPPDCDVLTDVISESLNQSEGYSGPLSLMHGKLPTMCSFVAISVVSHRGHRYGIIVYSSERLTHPVSNPPTLLIVDDNLLLLRAMKRVCSRWHPVRIAASAHEAVHWLSTDANIAAVLSDVDMPGFSGVQLLQACQLFRPDLMGRFILHSARPTPQLALPDVPFLLKPTPVALLRSTISQAMKR